MSRKFTSIFLPNLLLENFKHKKGCKDSTVNIHVVFALNILKGLFNILCLIISMFDVS